MKFSGFQKLTLLDFPEHVACTVFTAGCNLRCPFCHNALLVTDISLDEQYDEDEIIRYLQKRDGVLDGICITGGEPLLSDDTLHFMRRIKKETGVAIKLDTNGCFPERLSLATEEGLCDYVAMDIKNSIDKYALTVGIPSFDTSPVEESISLLLEGKVDYEFRTTVTAELHEVSDIEKISHMIKGAPRYFLQNFVDSGNLIGSGLSAPSRQTLDTMRLRAADLVDFVGLRGI